VVFGAGCLAALVGADLKSDPGVDRRGHPAVSSGAVDRWWMQVLRRVQLGDDPVLCGVAKAETDQSA
jgi:hypothetical protein